MPTFPPTLTRRHVVAGLAALGLIGGGAVAADAATAGPSAPGASATTTRPAPPAPKPHIDGTVTAVSGSTITVKDHDGFTRQLDVSSSTKYTLDGKASSFGAVRDGRFVHGDGAVDSDGTSLDASTVAISASAPRPAAGRDGRGPGARGPGGPAAPPKSAGGKAAGGPTPTPSSTSTAHGS